MHTTVSIWLVRTIINESKEEMYAHHSNYTRIGWNVEISLFLDKEMFSILKYLMKLYVN